MDFYDSSLYMQDVKRTAELALDWKLLKDKSLAISGGTGMIGSFLLDVLFYRNEHYGSNTRIYLLGRNEEKAKTRFGKYAGSSWFHFRKQDINQPISVADTQLPQRMDYIIHGASNTHPVAYATDPIGTISANVMGTDHLLRWAADMNCRRFVFLSSVEIYGENKGDTEAFREDYLGYLDCNTLRAGYPESKRTGEALCQAYRSQKKLDVVIPRLSRVYGPTMLLSDTKALSQFILRSVGYQDIILKSEGMQQFSYCYVADAVSGILKLMLEGQSGEAYNVTSDGSNLRLKELAEILARLAGKQVVFELPDAVERAGYSTASKALLDTEKIKALGWRAEYDMQTGLEHTVAILRELKSEQGK